MNGNAMPAIVCGSVVSGSVLTGLFGAGLTAAINCCQFTDTALIIENGLLGMTFGVGVGGLTGIGISSKIYPQNK